MQLSQLALEHFNNPRNVGTIVPNEDNNVVAAGAIVGEPVNQHILQLQVQVSKQEGLVIISRFRAYGCGWLIACGSLLTEYLIGQKLGVLGQFHHQIIIDKLQGLPPSKLYCAVLAEKALKLAYNRLLDLVE